MADKIRILAVDDEKFNLSLIKGCLGTQNYEIVGCTNAVDALQEFKKSYFDVLLLDVIMPGIDGFELRKLIRGIDAERPIVFLTSMVDDFKATMLNQIAGDPYTFYIGKSFTKKALADKIDQAVSIHRNRRLALDNNRRLEKEMALAGEIQNILLPNWCELNDHMVISSLYRPCNRVSGDLFEYFHIADAKYFFFIGDIAGHGMSAALYMSAILSFLKVTVVGRSIELHELMNSLNRFFCDELGSATYMTCLAAVIDFDADKIVMHSAGHPGLVGCSMRNDRTWNIGNDKQGNVPIGWFPDTVYTAEDNCEADFSDDTIIMAWSDGVFDVCDREGHSPDPNGFLKLVGELSESADAVTMPYRLLKSLEQFGYEERPDDVCVLALRKRSVDPNLIERVIPAQISYVSELAMEFSALVQERTESFELATKIELLLHEYLNNVIIHGSDAKKQRKNRIFVSLQFKPDALLVRGIDRGNFQEEDEVRGDADENTPSGGPATSGRGLRIIRDIASRISRSNYCGLNETVFTIKYEGGAGK